MMLGPIKHAYSLIFRQNQDSVTSERERHIPYDITYMWSLIYGTNESFHRKETNTGAWTIDLWLVAEGEGVGWTGSLGLADANCCIWGGQAMGSCTGNYMRPLVMEHDGR